MRIVRHVRSATCRVGRASVRGETSARPVPKAGGLPRENAILSVHKVCASVDLVL